MPALFLAVGQFLKRVPRFMGVMLTLTVLGAHMLAFAQEIQVLTNADIIKMVQVKLGTDVIVRQIRDNPGSYSLSTNSLVKLKQAGVPDLVIAAMQAKKPPNARQPGTATTKIPILTKTRPIENPYIWDVKDVVDRMSGTTHVVGYLTQRPSPNSSERLQAIATCGTFGDRGLNLLLIYASGTNPPAGFKQNIPDAPPQNLPSATPAPATTVTTGVVGYGIGGIAASLIAAFAYAAADSAAAPAAASAANVATVSSAPPSPWVEVQMKFDNEPPLSFTSTNQYSNYATVYLSAENTLKASHSNTLLFALPHEDGSPIYFEIRPKEPSFLRLAEMCKAYPPTMPELMMSGEFSQELTAKDLPEVVPQVLDSYTAEHRLPPDTYKQAASAMEDIVSACSMVTEPMVFSVTDNNVESLDRFGDVFGECSHPGAIDLSHPSGNRGSSAGAATIRLRGDLLLRISDNDGGTWTGSAEKGFFVSVGVGDLEQPLIKNLKIAATPNLKGPKFWFDSKGWGNNDDGGWSHIIVESYVAGPTWVPVSGNVKVSYRVHTKIEPNSDIQAELLRAPDVNGTPGSWAVINSHSFHLNGDWTDVILLDKPGEIGRYWYGTRVVDAGHREARESAALLVNVSPPPTADLAKQGIFPSGTDIVLASRQTTQTQSVPQRQTASAAEGRALVSDPALSYYSQGMALLRKNPLVDVETGKLILPPGCAEAFQKYLALAPDGQYAKSVKDILESAGVPVKPH